MKASQTIRNGFCGVKPFKAEKVLSDGKLFKTKPADGGLRNVSFSKSKPNSGAITNNVTNSSKMGYDEILVASSLLVLTNMNADAISGSTDIETKQDSSNSIKTKTESQLPIVALSTKQKINSPDENAKTNKNMQINVKTKSNNMKKSKGRKALIPTPIKTSITSPTSGKTKVPVGSVPLLPKNASSLPGKNFVCKFCKEFGKPSCGNFASKCPNRPCKNCDSRHRLGKCPVQSVWVRKKSACRFCKELGLNCGKFANKCPNRPCAKCNYRHRLGRCRRIGCKHCGEEHLSKDCPVKRKMRNEKARLRRKLSKEIETKTERKNNKRKTAVSQSSSRIEKKQKK